MMAGVDVRCLVAWGICFVGFLGVGTATAAPRKNGVVYVRIEVEATSADRSKGSGFLVDESGFIVTERHVVENFNRDKEKLFVHQLSKNAPPVPATIFKCSSNDKVDMCVLKIDAVDVQVKPYQVACRPLKDQEHIWVVGFPFGQGNQSITRDGKISGELTADFLYPTSAPFVQGMSGGPVFDETESVVVAIAHGGAEKNPTLTFVTPLDLTDALPSSIGCRTVTQPVPAPAPSHPTPSPTRCEGRLPGRVVSYASAAQVIAKPHCRLDPRQRYVAGIEFDQICLVNDRLGARVDIRVVPSGRTDAAVVLNVREPCTTKARRVQARGVADESGYAEANVEITCLTMRAPEPSERVTCRIGQASWWIEAETRR